jgi:hypothetical protein
MKAEVTKAVRAFFRNGTLSEGVNDTVIVLIPKGPPPKTLADFRPISLCNVVYKIISCMVKRLRPHLDTMISETQSAFLLGRLITDNAIIAFESFRKIQKSKNPSFPTVHISLIFPKHMTGLIGFFYKRFFLRWASVENGLTGLWPVSGLSASL